jgi:mannosyl-oligosaccharide glucosidase
MSFIHLTICVFSLVLSFCDASVSNAPDQLLWGPYRPNLYLGLRPRIPKSLSLGLMWSTVENGHLNTQNLRHTCEQKDGLAKYGWTKYNVRTGGSQTIVDPTNGLEMTTDFVKLSEDPVAGNWGLRINGKLSDSSSNSRNISVILYVALEEDVEAGPAHVDCARQEPGLNSVECKGTAPGLDAFTISMPSPKSDDQYQTSLKGISAVDEQLWQAKSK